jgi:hypothetical protein
MGTYSLANDLRLAIFLPVRWWPQLTTIVQMGLANCFGILGLSFGWPHSPMTRLMPWSKSNERTQLATFNPQNDIWNWTSCISSFTNSWAYVAIPLVTVLHKQLYIYIYSLHIYIYIHTQCIHIVEVSHCFPLDIDGFTRWKIKHHPSNPWMSLQGHGPLTRNDTSV